MKEQNKMQAIEEMAQDIWDSLPDYEHNFRDCRDAAQTLLAKGYRKQEWISVEERLPDETCECLAVDKLGIVYFAPYSSRYKTFNATDDDDGDGWRLNNITHWMPLPEPPKMKDGAE